MTTDIHAISTRDTEILRSLAARVTEIAADPIMAERRSLWKKLTALQAQRPMISVETAGVWDEIFPPSSFECEGEWARGAERSLRDKIFFYEHVKDDTVIDPHLTYGQMVHSTGYGVEKITHRSDGVGFGAVKWDAPLKNLPADLEKLHFRSFELDEQATERNRAMLEQVFGGVMPLVKRNWYWWTQGLTIVAIDLIGLEELMLMMYDEPEGLHALMAFLRDDHMQALDWFEQQGLLTLNNDNDYIGSGGRGFTDCLPQPDYVPGQPARIKDLWGLSESQETVGVSPELFEEFVFRYQLPLISRFGLAYYGCCEPLDARWEIVKRIPNLRSVSVSPWSNLEKMAENLGQNYVYSRKPNPAYVSSSWDEAVIREDLLRTVVATKGQNVELVLKDVHTICNEPWRLGRWVEIAREVIDEVYG